MVMSNLCLDRLDIFCGAGNRAAHHHREHFEGIGRMWQFGSKGDVFGNQATRDVG
jgi:hypothetical protein